MRKVGSLQGGFIHGSEDNSVSAHIKTRHAHAEILRACGRIFTRMRKPSPITPGQVRREMRKTQHR